MLVRGCRFWGLKADVCVGVGGSSPLHLSGLTALQFDGCCNPGFAIPGRSDHSSPRTQGGISPSLTHNIPPDWGLQHPLPWAKRAGIDPPVIPPTAQRSSASANCCLSLVNMDLLLLSAIRHRSDIAAQQGELWAAPAPPQRNREVPAAGSPEIPHLPGTSRSCRMSPGSLSGSGPSTISQLMTAGAQQGGWRRGVPRTPGGQSG